MEREFKGIWIPKEVWLDNRLNALEKIILMEIDSLDGEEHCFASNEYLAQFCQCSEKKISEAIAKLIQFEYIQVFSFDGRTRKLQSRLAENARQTCRKCEADLQKVQYSNIIENDKIIINNNKEKYKKEIAEIVSYLNKKADTSYRAGTEATCRLIRARLNEGYSVEDFKTVIDKKCSEWLGTDYEKFLRPETLFGNKFDGYLNAKSKKTEALGLESSFDLEEFIKVAERKK